MLLPLLAVVAKNGNKGQGEGVVVVVVEGVVVIVKKGERESQVVTFHCLLRLVSVCLWALGTK